MKFDNANFAEISAEIGCHGESGIYCTSLFQRCEIDFNGNIHPYNQNTYLTFQLDLSCLSANDIIIKNGFI